MQGCADSQSTRPRRRGARRRRAGGGKLPHTPHAQGAEHDAGRGAEHDAGRGQTPIVEVCAPLTGNAYADNASEESSWCRKGETWSRGDSETRRCCRSPSRHRISRVEKMGLHRIWRRRCRRMRTRGSGHAGGGPDRLPGISERHAVRQRGGCVARAAGAESHGGGVSAGKSGSGRGECSEHGGVSHAEIRSRYGAKAIKTRMWPLKKPLPLTCAGGKAARCRKARTPPRTSAPAAAAAVARMWRRKRRAKSRGRRVQTRLRFTKPAGRIDGQ